MQNIWYFWKYFAYNYVCYISLSYNYEGPLGQKFYIPLYCPQRHSIIHIYSEFTLKMKNMDKCVKEIRLCMWKELHQQLRVPPRHNAEEDCTISGVKVWLLTEPTSSWQKFAMALYSSTLDGALKCLKNLNLLPHYGS